MNLRSLSLALVFLAAPPTQADIIFSTNLQDWQNQIDQGFSQPLQQQTFVTNHANISASVGGGIQALVDPSDADYSGQRLDWNSPANNVDLGRSANFAKANTGLAWGFQITALEKHTVGSTSTTNHGTQYQAGDQLEAHIIYNDRIDRNNFDQVNAFTDVLSIGKAGGYDTDVVSDGDPFHWDNDDFRISINEGPALYALAFEIINNKKFVDTTINPDKPQSSDGGLYSYGKESITIMDSANQQHQITDTTGQLPLIPGYYNDPSTPEDEGRYADNFDDVQFIGIVSDTPINWLEFNEDSRSDDVGIRNLMFAGGVSTVPLPAGVWLLFSALCVLLRLKPRRR